MTRLLRKTRRNQRTICAAVAVFPGPWLDRTATRVLQDGSHDLRLLRPRLEPEDVAGVADRVVPVRVLRRVEDVRREQERVRRPRR
jgi:hypothetical protein